MTVCWLMWPGAQRGATLIELMIAVLVFSLGLLGTAALQLEARKHLFDAAQRSRATALGRDLLDRMRANPGQLADYEFSELGAPGRVPPSPRADCARAACSPPQLAAWDLFDWYRLLRGAGEALPGGAVVRPVGGLVAPRACIRHVDGHVTLTLRWRGRFEREGADGAACSVVDGASASRGGRSLHMATYVARWP